MCHSYVRPVIRAINTCGLGAMLQQTLCLERPQDTEYHNSLHNAVLILQGHLFTYCHSTASAEGHPLNITIYLLISLSPYVSEHRGNPFRAAEAYLWHQSKTNSSFSSLHSTNHWPGARVWGALSSSSLQGCVLWSHSQWRPFLSWDSGRK